MNPSDSFRSSSAAHPSVSRTSFSSFSSGRRSSSSASSSHSSRRQETRVTFDFFRRDSTVTGDSPSREDDVAMSNAGQRVIPAVFKLEPLGGSTAVTNATNEEEADLGFSQAGGHDNSFRSDGKTLVKRVTDREASFYERAERGEWPVLLLPKYFGRTGDGGIKIENLTYGMRRPCVIDLKMGVQTVEDDEKSRLKKLKMNALDRVTRSKSAGVRLEGLSMYRTMENTRVKGSKKQSHTISAKVNVSLQDVLTFFLSDDQGVRTDVAVRFQSAVENIREHFKKNDKFRFIGSSILLIYDNDNRAPHMLWLRALRKLHKLGTKPLTDDQISGLTRRTKCDVRMIDFAHTSEMPEGMNRDEGYLTGLTTVIDALKGIRKYRDKPIFEFSSAVVDRLEEQRAVSLSHCGSIASSPTEIPEGGEMLFESILGRLTALQTNQEESEEDGN